MTKDARFALHGAQALRVQELLVRAHQDAAIVVDGSGCVVSVNDRAASLYGVTPDEALGWMLPRLIGRRAGALMTLLLEDARALDEPFSRRSTIHVRPDGTEVHVAVHVAADEHLGLLLVVDRSETQQQLEELEIQAVRMGQLETLTRSGLWGWHLDDGTLEWSPGMFQLHAITPDRFAGTMGWYLGMIDTAHRETLIEAAQTAIVERRTAEATISVVRGDGAPRWLRMALDRTSNHTVVATATDVTRSRETIAELGRLNEGLDRVAFTVAHDVQSPMVSTLGFAQLIQRVPDLPEDARMLAERIVSSAKSTVEFIREVVETASSAAQGHAETSLGPCVEWAQSMLAHEIERTGARIVAVDELPTMPGRQATLRQLVLNLLSNSLKFAVAERDCVITIAGGTAEDGTIWATFGDNGRGIPEDQRDRVFSRGFRADNVTDVAGTGLGLWSAVANVVDAGAAVTIEDPADGQPGVVFRVTFPPSR